MSADEKTPAEQYYLRLLRDHTLTKRQLRRLRRIDVLLYAVVIGLGKERR